VFIPLARRGPVRQGAIFLTRPVPALMAFEFSILVWHIPGFYDAALFNQGIHYGQHASFILGGMLFWWNLIRPYPFVSRLHPLLRIAMLFAASVVNGGLSALIVFSGEVLYGYQQHPGFWGLTMLMDQEIGSALMWVMGGMWRLAAITLIFVAFAYEENAKEPGIRAALERRRARSFRGLPQGA
jgi:cytochrome c oxidase assembly factor CtaG